MTAGASAHVLAAFSDAKQTAKSANAKTMSAKIASAKTANVKTANAKSVQERGHYVSLGERDPHVASVAVTSLRNSGLIASSRLNPAR